MPLADIHCHLLPGLDDGARDWGTTEAMLRRDYENGIAKVIATTHADPTVKPFPLSKYMEALEKANELCGELGLGVTVYPGCEVMYGEGVTERMLEDGRLPGLAGTRKALVEFYPDVKYDAVLAALRRLAYIGYTAVLAHIERYECLYKRYDRIRELREAGAKTQVNCSTVIKPPGFFAKRYIDTLLSDGLVDYLATDAHSDNTRRVNMKEAYDTVIARYPDRGHLFEGKELLS
ncbi:MAG: hypothetical protein LBS11_11555 [Oscillospiraceae bacterium]|jgi:protein-tyrosine phosphatase|nr:hypothetical protein [Oscillospiraceae bacterium]